MFREFFFVDRVFFSSLSFCGIVCFHRLVRVSVVLRHSRSLPPLTHSAHKLTKSSAKMLRDSGLLDERDYQTYCHLFANMSNFMNKPNLIIFLDVSPEESLERIKQRSRDCESTISLEYLQNLYRAYNEFILEIARAIPVIRVNYSKFRTAEEMAAMIKEEYEKMRLIHTVDFDSKTRAAGSAD
eukprot:TRINITY_DN5994_c0_g1_i1.p1 TRINITY_DN5994_c0_g1~~TRINITY_DN5994_c0_g1_i1.p1  ORF type:complete len:184 (+),score=46.69 TRINITY_DN5994_c0_g1_i1:424-975(+)